MAVRSKLWMKFALLAFGVFAGLMLCELSLRAIGVSYPLPYVPDQHCGTRLYPGFHGWWTKEGRAYLQINAAGFRHGDRGWGCDLRIAVLGDSFVEAFQVDEEQTLCSQIERSLDKCENVEGRTLEVLNFGVSGYGTGQQLQMLRHHAAGYNPDVVVLALFPGNDIRNNSKALEPYKVRPFFYLEDDELKLDDSFLQHPDYLKAQSAAVGWKVALINRSRLLQLLNEIRNRPAPTEDDETSLVGGAGIDQTAWIEPPDDDWREAWNLTECLILEVRKEAETQGAKFLLLVIGCEAAVHPKPEVERELCRQLQVEDLRYPERRLEQLGKEHGFPVLGLSQPMSEYARKQNKYLHGFANTRLGVGHWNAEGHRVAAKLAAKAICDLAPLEE